MPLSFAGELGLRTLVDQFDKIMICGKLIRINRRGRSQEQDERKEDNVQAIDLKDMGPRLQRRSPMSVISGSKPWQGLDAWQLRR